MKRDYKNQLSKIFPFNEDDLEKLLNNISYNEMPSGTILLSEGEIATKLFIVIHGCLRAFFIKENGIDVTFQFFIENQIVASFESATTGTSSRLYIEAIEDSVVGFIRIDKLEKIISEYSSFREHFNRFLIRRLTYYMNHYSSYILDNPEKRYLRFLKENPDLVSRLPKQYIASYLGITPVSLSRIRSRLKK
jgi:CRP-like cAMP-binding protein